MDCQLLNGHTCQKNCWHCEEAQSRGKEEHFVGVEISHAVVVLHYSVRGDNEHEKLGKLNG